MRTLYLPSSVLHGRHLRHRRDASLGAQLRRVRDRQGLSLGTVSSMLCVSRQQLEHIERGTLTEGPAVDRVSRWLTVPGPPDPR